MGRPPTSPGTHGGWDQSPEKVRDAMVGFAPAEYALEDDVDPVRLSFADDCHDKFLKREARLASAQTRLPTSHRKRRQPATYVL